MLHLVASKDNKEVDNVFQIIRSLNEENLKIKLRKQMWRRPRNMAHLDWLSILLDMFKIDYKTRVTKVGNPTHIKNEIV